MLLIGISKAQQIMKGPFESFCTLGAFCHLFDNHNNSLIIVFHLPKMPILDWMTATRMPRRKYFRPISSKSP
jgi:hypothetical protein